MIKVGLRWSVLVTLIFCVSIPVAHANDYVKPTLPNLVKTLIRFGAMGIKEDDVIDEYALLQECKIVLRYQDDDFKWQQVRAAMRKSIKQGVADYPMSYAYEATLQLARYDFKNKYFSFSAKTAPQNVNVFTVSHHGHGCADKEVKILPETYRFVLNEPLYLPGLPLPEKDAETLLRRMEANNNPDRLVFGRFNIRVTYVEPLHRNSDPTGKSTGPLYQRKDNRDVRLDSKLDSAEFFEDEEMTKLIYTYRP